MPYPYAGYIVEVERKKLEEKSLRCVKLAQLILPGANDTTIEDQAVDFMRLTDSEIDKTIQRLSVKSNVKKPAKPKKIKTKNRYQLLKESLCL